MVREKYIYTQPLEDDNWTILAELVQHNYHNVQNIKNQYIIGHYVSLSSFSPPRIERYDAMNALVAGKAALKTM